MSVTWTEQWDRRLSSRDAVRYYYGTSDAADDEGDAYDELASTAPATLFGLPIDDIEVNEVEGHDDAWLGVARYAATEFSLPAQPEVGTPTYSFDTGGGQQHITHGLAHISTTPSAAATPTFGGAIGVTKDGVEGVDIDVAAYTFSETHVFPAASVTLAYKGILFARTNQVNDALFKGFAIGECRFLGASGQSRSDGTVEINFRFSALPNRVTFDAGGITVPAKKGWEYLWLYYEDFEDTTANRTVKRALGAYVEQVYELGDMSTLGIGV